MQAISNCNVGTGLSDQMREANPELSPDKCFELLKDRVPALWKDGKIVVNISNVRPSEVPFKIRHEALLHEAAHRLRRQRAEVARGGQGEGVRMDLFDNPEKRTRVIGALQKIADGADEVTVNGLRNDLEQYGGTNDISFVWGNPKKGFYHIVEAKKRGLDTLFHVIDAVSDGQILRYVEGNKTVILEKDGYEAVLALTEFGKRKSWLLSGWKVNEPDATGEVSTQSDATQPEPTFSRQELGAGLKDIIARFGENSSGIRKAVDEVAPPVESEQFKAWFKQSKVVDENGEPLVVYHGTNWDMLSEAPGNAAFSDSERGTGSGDDILTILARAAKAEVARRRGGGAQGNGTRFATDPECGKAFPLRTENTYAGVLRILREISGKPLHNAEYRIDAKLSANGINKILSNTAREKSIANGFTDEQHLQAAANIDRLFENGILIEDRPDRNNDPNIKSIKRFAAPFFTGGDFAEARITLKESVEAGHRVYSLELDEIRKPSDVTGGEPDRTPRPSDGPQSASSTDAIKQHPTTEGYNKLLQKIEKARALLEKSGEKSSAAGEDIRKTDVSKSDVSDQSDNTRLSIDDDGAGFVEPVPFVSSIDDSRGKNIVAMLRPIVGRNQANFDKEALARNIKERYGVDVSPVEALLWAREAALRRDRRTRAIRASAAPTAGGRSNRGLCGLSVPRRRG